MRINFQSHGVQKKPHKDIGRGKFLVCFRRDTERNFQGVCEELSPAVVQTKPSQVLNPTYLDNFSFVSKFMKPCVEASKLVDIVLVFSPNFSGDFFFCRRDPHLGKLYYIRTESIGSEFDLVLKLSM